MIITRHATEYMITAEQKHENVKLHKRIDLFVNLCINNMFPYSANCAFSFIIQISFGD